jgi:hypothetical protein
MIPTKHLHSVLSLLALLLGLRPATAQDPFAAQEQELTKKTVSTLLSFGNTARSSKVGQRAKQAFDLVLAYDPENSSARSELGFLKDKGKWIEQPPEKRKKWVDKATYEARFKIMDEWYKTAMKLGELHRGLGLKMKEAGNLVRATYHLEKAVYYNAMDKVANEALGYKLGPGFYGTDEQITFANKMKEIETTAIQIAKKDYAVEALPDERMPKELVALRDAVPDWMKKPSFDISGAKSAHFTVWTRGTPENAANAVKWGERAIEFGVYLLGEEKAKRLRFVERASGAFAWYGFLWTGREREEFLKANPHVWEKDGSIQRAKDFANNIFQASEGSAVVLVKLAPVQIHDSMIGYTFHHGLVAGRNQGMGEGIIHAVTWYLQSTSISRWGARPTGGSATERELNLPDTTNWWLRAIRDQATSHQDWAMDQVPREKLTRYRNDCRLKAWSSTTWMMAAYPEKWLEYYLALPADEVKVPTLEDIDAIGEKVFTKKMQQLDDDWREWARGDSGVAAGTGYGPPLLPERPSKEELSVLDRLNAIRGAQIAYSWPEKADVRDGTFGGLPPCELDAEASAACEAHSRYLTRWTEEHMKWPEAHEENPARDGFSPKGQRAGMSSVIVFLNGQGGMEFARDSVDGWIGTPYHRFPLLVQNIKRFGYCFIYENEWTVATLDMGSLEEPYDPDEAPRFVIFPANNMKDVPRSFHGREFPNPLEDQPPEVQDITKTGFPISLQLQRELAAQLADAEILLFECKHGGKQPAKNYCSDKQGSDYKDWCDRCGANPKAVPIWAHTPNRPLNKRVEVRDTIFCLPKAHLEANQSFQVRVRLQLGGNDPLWFIWEFTTGSQEEGLKFK